VNGEYVVTNRKYEANIVFGMIFYYFMLIYNNIVGLAWDPILIYIEGKQKLNLKLIQFNLLNKSTRNSMDSIKIYIKFLKK
jgi:hypothetical protein